MGKKRKYLKPVIYEVKLDYEQAVVSSCANNIASLIDGTGGTCINEPQWSWHVCRRENTAGSNVGRDCEAATS